MSRVVPTSAGNNRHSTASLLEYDLHNAPLLRVGERRAFARRSARHKKVDAFADLKINEAAQRVLIDRQVFVERRDQRRPAALQVCDILHFAFLLLLTTGALGTRGEK